jgi:hypothetical protein
VADLDLGVARCGWGVVVLQQLEFQGPVVGAANGDGREVSGLGQVDGGRQDRGGAALREDLDQLWGRLILFVVIVGTADP